MATIGSMLAHVGGAGQDGVDLPKTPASAIARANLVFVEETGDGLDAHRPIAIGALKRKQKVQSYRLRMKRIDLQCFFDFRSSLLDLHRTVADGRPGAVPISLPGIFAHGAQRMLGVFLRLIFVEQGHDLAHHRAHRIVAHVLGDREDLHSVLRQLAGIALELEHSLFSIRSY